MASQDPGGFEYKIAGRTIFGAIPKSGTTGDKNTGSMEYKFAGRNFAVYLFSAQVNTNLIWTLPSGDADSPGQALVSDAAGILSWETPAASGGGGTDLTGLGVNNTIARWDGTDTLQSSDWEILDTGEMNKASGMNFQIATTDKFIITSDECSIETGFKINNIRTETSTSPYTVLLTDYLMLDNNNVGAKNFNLPLAATAGSGKIYGLKKIHSTAGNTRFARF